MGIVYPISRWVNALLKAHGTKPEWALNTKGKRALRYAEAYARNAELIAKLNRR